MVFITYQSGSSCRHIQACIHSDNHDKVFTNSSILTGFEEHSFISKTNNK